MQLKSLSLTAMALEMPDFPGHPNRHPFSGVLTKLDQPSTRPPEGSGGRLVVMPMAVAEAALDSVIGMAVDWSDGTGHEPTRKVGVITEAHIEGDDLHVSGHLFPLDFPEVVATIRSLRPLMGMSYELANVTVEDQDAPQWVLTGCVFTGAAILLKQKAAYHATSLAAAAQKENPEMDELLKQLAAAMTQQGDSFAKLAAAAEKTNELLAAGASKVEKEQHDLFNGTPADKDGPMGGRTPDERGQVKAKTEPVNNLPEEERNLLPGGEAAHKVTAKTEPVENLPEVERKLLPGGEKAHKVTADADVEADDMEADDMDGKATKKMKAQLDALQAKYNALAAANEAVLKAAAAEPTRKTISPEISQLLAKHSLNASGEKMNAEVLDAALKAGNVSITQRLAAMGELLRTDHIDPQ